MTVCKAIERASMQYDPTYPGMFYALLLESMVSIPPVPLSIVDRFVKDVKFGIAFTLFHIQLLTFSLSSRQKLYAFDR